MIVKLNNKTIPEKWPHLNLPQTNYFLNTLEYFSPNNPKNNLICYYHPSNTQLYFQYNESSNKSYSLITQNTSEHGQIQLQTYEPSLPSNLNFINISNSKIYKKDNSYNIQIDIQEILALIKTQQQYQLIQLNQNLPLPQITLPSYDIQIIQDYIQPFSYQNQLINLYYKILDLNSDTLHFYTDASIKNIQTSQIQAGIAWISKNQPNIYFNVAVTPYPDTSRTEMEAILYLLLTIPSNSTINIHLDNKTTINYLKSLADTTTTQRKNWDIIHIINQILTKKYIQLITHKVKSHSNNYLHNQADLLAK